MKHLRLCLILLFVFLIPVNILFGQNAVVKEEIQTIKTYPFSEPDPVPVLTKKPHIYPYFSFNKYSHKGINRDWKVVRLENDFVKMFVLPEVGGKVYGAIDKTSGNEFIYHNKVLKFRQIALRGPWTSGGIEFNFGVVGHTPATASPVDYVLRNNPDGSVSCIVGALDLPSRTRWSVDIRLPEDKAYFETNALWYNSSPLNQSYYTWITSAISAGNDLKYDYPGRFVVPHSHSIPAEPWPVDKKGRDLSWYKNNNFGGSKTHFVLGEYENFFGNYWFDKNFGMGHWALYDDVPGKKVWIWALSRSGAIWEDLLTDTDGQYSEPQSGRLFSQADHEFFQPYRGDKWQEIWFPFSGIGGLVQASPHAALNIKYNNVSISAGIYALQAIDDELVVKYGGKELVREHLKLRPAQIFKKEIPKPDYKGYYEIIIKNKLYYTDDPSRNDIKRPVNYHRIKENSAEGLFHAGEFFEKQRKYGTALEKYLACLEMEPLHTRALVRTAEIYCRRAEYKKGLEFTHKALENSMYDPDANYVYGVISRFLGDLTNAKETMGWAARSMEYRSAAYCQLAEICIIEGNFILGEEYARKSLDFNRFNLRAYEAAAISYRKSEQTGKAVDILDKLTEIDPLNHTAGFERYLLIPGKERLERFKSGIRNELPCETYLETAVSYANTGLYDEAVKLLEFAPEHPVIHYWMAYLLKDSSPEQSGKHLKKAAGISPHLIFPFREETIPVLRWAVVKQPHDWKAKYYLGLIYWSKGRIEEARLLFTNCDEPDYSTFYIIMGSLFPEKAETYYIKAVNLDKNSWQNLHYLANFYNRANEPDKALRLTQNAAEKFHGQVFLTMDHARALFQNGQYKKCLDILNAAEVLPYEGGWEAQNLFMRAQLHLGMQDLKTGNYKKAVEYFEGSKKYPEHLGSGEPFEADFRLQDLLIYYSFKKMQDRKNEDMSLKKIYDYTKRNWTETGRYYYIGALALKQFDGPDTAKKYLKEWEFLHPGNPDIKWSMAKINGKKSESEKIEVQRSKDPRFKIMLEAVNLAGDYLK